LLPCVQSPLHTANPRATRLQSSKPAFDWSTYEMPSMDVPRITSTHMGTGQFRATPLSDPRTRAIADTKAAGLQM